MREILNTIITNAKWTYPAFDKKIIIEGRILSPVEAQTVGIGSALIAAGIADRKDLEKITNLKEDVDEKNVDEIWRALKNFDADKILKMAENQDEVLCKCICRGSNDEGATWQQLHVVKHEKQQNAKSHRLWVGMFSDEDRKNMIELCLEGHKKAQEAIRGQV